MSVQHEHALLEVQLQLEFDEQRGVPPLAPRARALQQDRASGDQQAQRQALIDLAAACVAIAARLPAPIHALNELKLRTTIPTATTCSQQTGAPQNRWLEQAGADGTAYQRCLTTAALPPGRDPVAELKTTDEAAPSRPRDHC